MKTIKSLNYRGSSFKKDFYCGEKYLPISIFAILIGLSIVLAPKILLVFSSVSVLFLFGILKPEMILPIFYLAILTVGTRIHIFQIGSVKLELTDGLLIIFVFTLILRLFLKRRYFLKLNISIILIITLIFLGIIVGIFLLGNNPMLIRNDVSELLYIPIIYIIFLATIKTKKQAIFLVYFIIIATSIAAFKAIYIAF